MAKSNKKLGLYSSLSNIPDMIVQDGIEYYRIYAKKETKDEVKYIEHMNTKYYSDIPLTYTDETTGIVYYVDKPEKPEQPDPENPIEYKLIEIIPEDTDEQKYYGQTYYAWVIDEEPESVEIDGVTYYLVKPEQPGDNYRLVTTVPEGDLFNGSTYYAWIEIPASVEIDGVTYYLVKPEQPNYKWELVEVTPEGEEYDGRTYYAWTFDYPEKIELDGVEYYFTKQDQPGDEYVEKTLEYEGHTYYAWVIVEFPDSIVVDGVTYYKVQPENPGEGYHLATVDYYGTLYYAWIEDEQGGDEPEPVYPESVEIDGVVYYLEQKEKPEGNYKLVSIVPEGEEYGGQTYYAWIEDEQGGDEPEPSGDLFYIGIEEINENNYRELATEELGSKTSLEYIVPDADDENPDGYTVYVFISDSHNILSSTTGIMTITTPEPSTIVEGYKLYTYSVDVYGLDGASLTIQLS